MPAPSAPVPLAHSDRGRGSQTYADHAGRVGPGAEERAAAVARRGRGVPKWFAKAAGDAGWFHDLGKLDPANQAVLRGDVKGPLPVDHVDAGAAHLFNEGGGLAAWLVRSHHAPGLPDVTGERAKPKDVRHRGLRHRDRHAAEHRELVAATKAALLGFLKEHAAVCGGLRAVTKTPPVCLPREYQRGLSGLPLRLALSCLVDADHADTARHERGVDLPKPPCPKWAERLARLDQFVAALDRSGDPDRARRRDAFFHACRHGDPYAERVVSCEGPVGIGKTLAVAARLLRHCEGENLRHLIVVAPFTNIVSQTAATLRRALTLPDERGEEVVAEHHHRADFDSPAARDAAATWKAPVTVTTAVQLFETLAGCAPAALRKLHELPGSAVFLDEAHASLSFTASRTLPGGGPVRYSHWPRAWGWLRELADDWGCRVVLASGSQVRFWEVPDLTVGRDRTAPVPPLAPAPVAGAVAAEGRRVRYERCGTAFGAAGLADRITTECGPRLAILNTVQSAAVVARASRDAGHNVLHLSTALTPDDRGATLKEIETRLDPAENYGPDWTLVATSCVEAGVDLSFRVGFRERCSVASLIQTGGRVNRHGEYDAATVFSFALADAPPLTKHPGFAHSAAVLDGLFGEGRLDDPDPSALVTEAIRRELATLGGTGANDPDRDALVTAERNRDYPLVAWLGRVIAADTRIVVVDTTLQNRLRNQLRDRTAPPVRFRDLLAGSVQLWATKIDALGMEPAPGFGDDLYFWEDAYEPDFLGVMAGLLNVAAVKDLEAIIV